MFKVPFQNRELEWNLSNVLWTVAFSMIVVTSVLGNTMVLWTVCGKVLICLNFMILGLPYHLIGQPSHSLLMEDVPPKNLFLLYLFNSNDFQHIDECGVWRIISSWTWPSLTWWWQPSTPSSPSSTWEIGTCLSRFQTQNFKTNGVHASGNELNLSCAITSRKYMSEDKI